MHGEKKTTQNTKQYLYFKNAKTDQKCTTTTAEACDGRFSQLMLVKNALHDDYAS